MSKDYNEIDPGWLRYFFSIFHFITSKMVELIQFDELTVTRIHMSRVTIVPTITNWNIYSNFPSNSSVLRRTEVSRAKCSDRCILVLFDDQIFFIQNSSFNFFIFLFSSEFVFCLYCSIMMQKRVFFFPMDHINLVFHCYYTIELGSSQIYCCTGITLAIELFSYMIGSPFIYRTWSNGDWISFS